RPVSELGHVLVHGPDCVVLARRRLVLVFRLAQAGEADRVVDVMPFAVPIGASLAAPDPVRPRAGSGAARLAPMGTANGITSTTRSASPAWASRKTSTSRLRASTTQSGP